jgi:uncharacterized membrane protein
MAEQQTGSNKCPACGRDCRPEELVPAQLVRDPLVEVLRQMFPAWDGSSPVCREDLDRARSEHITRLIKDEYGEVSGLEQEIVHSIAAQELLSRNVDAEFEEKLSLGDRVADRVADFGGSWRFIISFLAVMAAWVVLNSVVLILRPFDPYPFILLNLVLSCLAAMQAPVIMMSQNRQEAKDRLRAQHDYQVNLKAEIEIRALHEKLDHLVMKQWQRLLEIQAVQMDLMEDIARLTRAAAGQEGGGKPAGQA